MPPDPSAIEEAAAEPPAATASSRVGSAISAARRLAYLCASLYLFAFALMLMQVGARGLQPLIRDILHVDSAANSLGFGWLSAYVILSGSPVAAMALTLMKSELLDPLGGYAMITGSRLGASLIVLVIGFVYTLRGHERSTALSMGVLSFLVTAVVQVAALVLGGLMIVRHMVPPIDMEGSGAFTAITDRLMGSAVESVSSLAESIGGAPLVFVAGLAVILTAFAMFDRGLPPLGLKGTALGDVGRVLYRPSIMFLLGSAVTFVSMSVSVSLSLLVPLSARGFIRRENVIPYIMGANITTYMDTLIGSLIIATTVGVSVVITQMIAVTIVSLFVMLFAMRPFEQATLKTVAWSTASNRNLGLFLLVLFTIPIALLVI